MLKGVSLQVPKGAVVARLGGNGAGKTTTLRAVSNLLAAERGAVTKGSVELRGQSIVGLSTSDMVNRGVIQVGADAGKGLQLLSTVENTAHQPSDIH